jgi:predicted nuclease of restriction endonuclease-like (RecB) superfamily
MYQPSGLQWNFLDLKDKAIEVEATKQICQNFFRSIGEFGRGGSYLLVNLHDIVGTWEDKFRKLPHSSVRK